MLFAFATTILFSFSAVFANRSVQLLGPMRANFARLIVACVVLGAYAHAFGFGVSGPAFWWFLLSGAIGLGLGDLALFLAYPRIGSRLTVLLTQCLAAPIAALVEWSWLGLRPTTSQALCGAAILVGVVIALAPARSGKARAARSGVLIAGLIAGVFSAIGQGGGAVVSRQASTISADAGQPVDGMSAAYQRILGGILFTSVTLLPFRRGRGVRTPAVNPATLLRPELNTPPPPSTADLRRETLGQAMRRGWPWVLCNALAGPVLGVACFQASLATTPSAIVLPIVALTPITVMPLAWFFERDRPTTRAVLGGAIAVAAAIALARAGG